MSTIIMPCFRYLNSRIKRPWNITKLAKERSLHISNQDEVGFNVIALDVLKRKLLFANKKTGASSCLMVDLKNLERCTIKKDYNSINAGELKKMKLHHFLKSIILNLVFKNGSPTLSLSIFDRQKERGGNPEQLETLAEKWQKIVSKLLPVYKGQK
jgi:hypothetical protein